MQTRSSRRTPEANGTPVDSTLHALVATPAVGSVLMLFVVVGMAALAAGMLSGFTTRHRARRDAARELP